jgi:hypothetical protein
MKTLAESRASSSSAYKMTKKGANRTVKKIDEKVAAAALQSMFTAPVSSTPKTTKKSIYERGIGAVAAKESTVRPDVVKRLIKSTILSRNASPPQTKAVKGSTLKKDLERISKQLEASGAAANRAVTSTYGDMQTKNIGRASDLQGLSPAKKRKTLGSSLLPRQKKRASSSPSPKLVLTLKMAEAKSVDMSMGALDPNASPEELTEMLVRRRSLHIEKAAPKDKKPRGLGRKSTVFLDFEEARTIVRSLKLKGARAWWHWSKNFRPENIPSTPDVTYRGKGWAGMQDWLGTDTVSTRANHLAFLSFEDARKYVRQQKLSGKKAWREWSRAKRPAFIPSTPQRTYLRKGWIGMCDWLGSAASRRQSKKPSPK